MKIYKHNFDSSDWKSIVKEIEIVNEAGQMLFGETLAGETIIFDVLSR